MDDICVDVGDIEWGGVEWIGLAQDRDKQRALVNAVMNLRGPYRARTLSSAYTTGGLLSSAQLHSQLYCRSYATDE
jgi:hypothetical protein